MMRLRHNGFSLVEIMIVVAIIAILLAIAVPGYLKIRASSKRTVCINNLKKIDAAIDQWAIEKNVGDGTDVPEEIYGYIKGEEPKCPSGGTYTLYPVGSRPQVRCSFEGDGHKLPE